MAPCFWETSKPQNEREPPPLGGCTTLGVAVRHPQSPRGSQRSQGDAARPPALAEVETQAVAQTPLEPLTPRRRKRLLQLPPNLLHATFSEAQRQSPGEQWLQQRIETFDSGAKRQRKRVLEEFLEYVDKSGTTGMEALFSTQAHLFFVRLTSWFATTLPILYELPLQLRVFLTFLAFREEKIIRSFFESGTLEPLLHTLSVVCDAPDHVRSLVITILHQLALGGRTHKELLCSQGLIEATAECMASGGLRWGAGRRAGRLLYELFKDNPKYQPKLLDTLQNLMAQKVPLAQRVSTQMLTALLTNEQSRAAQLLADAARHEIVVQLGLNQLENSDLHVAADAFRLVGSMLKRFDCDELVLAYARRQLQVHDAEQWLRLEVGVKSLDGNDVKSTDAHDGTADSSDKAGPSASSQLPKRHRGATLWLHRCVTLALSGQAFDANSGPALGGGIGLDKFSREAIAAEFDRHFCEQASQVLKWGLVICLAKRNAWFCTEIVEKGFTQTLLICLLDSTRPVCQASALVELHRLRLLSKEAQAVAQAVLSDEMLRAMTLEQFTAVADSDAMARARYRLRNLRPCKEPNTGRKTFHRSSHCAGELGLRQRLVEEEMTNVMMSEKSADNAVFNLTAADVDKNSAEQEELVPRSGPDRYDVLRVTSHQAQQANAGGGITGPMLAGPGGGDGAGGYHVVMGPVEEIPLMGSMISLLIDLADSEAGEDMFASQEPMTPRTALRDASLVSTGSIASSKLSDDSARRRRQMQPPKESHRMTSEQKRALHFRSVPPRGVEARTGGISFPIRKARIRRRPSLAASIADSEHTELSVRIAGAEQEHVLFKAADHLLPHAHAHGCGCGCHSMDELHEFGSSASSASLHNATDDELFAELVRKSTQPPKVSSITDTSLGPEPSRDLSMEAFSREFPSVDQRSLRRDSLDAGHSLEAEPSWDVSGMSGQDAFIREISNQSEIRHQNLLEGIGQSTAVRIQKGTVVAMVEILNRSPVHSLPSSQLTSGRSSPRELPRAVKRVFHVQAAPYHECVAFDKTEGDRVREGFADHITRLLHPRTRRKFENLRQISGFPRPRLGSAASSSVSSYSAPGPSRQFPLPLDGNGVAVMRNEAVGRDPIAGFFQAGSMGPQAMHKPGKIKSLREYFPASART